MTTDLASAAACTERALLRSALRWSDVWRAPLHDFPIRDEILYQYFPLSRHMDVLEIGPGSGFTAFRLARLVRRLTLVEVAEEAVAELRARLGGLSNLRVVCADVTWPRLAERLREDFDAAFALDVFEYVTDPQTCLRNLAVALRPGGEAFLSFPNVPRPPGDGVTWFTSLRGLEALLEGAGFERWKIFAVRRRPFAAAAHGALHDWPLDLYRRIHNGHRPALPQTYEATWAFRERERVRPYQNLLHLYWAAVDRLLRLGGDVFEAVPVTEQILGLQLVVRAWT